MIRLAVLAAIGIAALLVVASALAVAPVITGVGSKNLHPLVTFTAPKSDHVVIEIASKPDRATDGAFLSENEKAFALLTDSEIQGGAWLDDSQLDPGQYWVLMRASPDFDLCYDTSSGGYDSSCANGYSELVKLTILRPASRYRGDVAPLLFLHQARLTFVVTPLGDRLPYRVCYPNAKKQKRCLTGVVSGFSWNSSANDDLSLNTRGLARFTTFTWIVGGKRVAVKRARVR